MCYILFNAITDATAILIEAQRQCEEIYMDAEEIKPKLIKFEPKDQK